MDSKIIVDVFMLTNTKNKDYFEVTRDAILSLKASENISRFQIYLIESNINSEFHEYYIGLGCDLILFNDEFSFSKAMNYALRHGKNRYALLTNNDVKFDKNWFDEIHKNLNLENVAVWSTFDPNLNFNIESNVNVVEGYKPCGVHSGWCYLIDVDKLGNNRFLSEEFDLWFMDDDFCMRLQDLNLKQVLCKNSIVYHLNGKSNEFRQDFQNRTFQDKIRFINKHRYKIRIHSVQFLDDRTVINFESFDEGDYIFNVSGDANYQTVIDMKIGVYYYICLPKSKKINFNVTSNNYTFNRQFTNFEEKAKIETFIFVHDQNIILDFEKNQKFKNLKNLKYVFLGNRPIDLLIGMNNVIVARELPHNIEEYKLLTSFTGWYALWKNDLVNADYLNLLEYDVIVDKNFWPTLENNLLMDLDIIGYIKYPIDFHWIWQPDDVIKPFFDSIYNRRGINLEEFLRSIPPTTECSMTSNHTISKSTFYDYMIWMEHTIQDLKNEFYAGHNTERSIMSYALYYKSQKYKIQEGVLQHLQLDSHKTQKMGDFKFESNYDGLVKNII